MEKIILIKSTIDCCRLCTTFQITGNLLLMVFYDAILGVAAKCISGMDLFSKAVFITQSVVSVLYLVRVS